VERIFFDNRSSHSPRITGWERVARELSSRLKDMTEPEQIYFYTSKLNGSRSRLLSDVTSLPLKARDYDVLHFPTFPPTFRHENRTVLYNLYDLTWWKLPETSSFLGKNYYRKRAENSIRNNAFILTSSKTMKNEIMQHFDLSSERVFVSKLGTATCSCNELELTKKSNTRPYFLSVGTVEPRKNLELLTSAFRKSGRARTHDLKIVGRSGWGNLNLSGAEVITNCSERELHEYYRNCEAVVQPSLYEGFGLPLIEALAHGKKLICSDIPIFREIVEDKAWFVDPTSLEGWIDALNNSDSMNFSKAELIKFSLKFNWDTMAAETLAVYKQISQQVGRLSP
jgi:glycosyltransferase involved in cell wall biosynthesis